MNKDNAWKLRLAVGILMLCIALFGMIFTDIRKDGSWLYWRLMTPVYALLSLGLSLYLRHKKLKTVVLTIWHEVVHWLSLMATIYILSLLVNMGFVSRFQAGIEVLLLLALATFLAGIYIESTLLIIGAVLGVLILTIGFLNQYLYVILVPVIVLAAICLFFLTRNRKSSPDEPLN